MAKPGDLLLLKDKDFRSEVLIFFKDLNKDQELRSLFFTNPSLVLRTRLPSLGSIDVSDQQDELANRVLFSVLSNDRFKTFLKDYQQKKNKALARFLKSPGDEKAASALDERTIKTEFAEALLEFGDKELLFNIIGRSSSITQPGGSLGWFAIFVVVFLVAAAVHAVLALGTSGDFAPTAPGKLLISASELRKIAHQLVAAAMKAREAGDLTP